MRSFQLIKVLVCPEETVLVFLEETSRPAWGRSSEAPPANMGPICAYHVSLDEKPMQAVPAWVPIPNIIPTSNPCPLRGPF